MKVRTLLSLFLVSLVVFCARTEEVTEVIDGDTFRTATGSSVRLLGINAPEISDPGGDIAKHALAWMIMSKNVHMVRDITDKDDYGRLLRYVFVGDVNVNAEMVRLGYAELRFFPPDTMYLEEMRELEKVAIRNRSGLWALPVFQFSDTTAGAAPKTVARAGELDVIQWQEADQYYNQNKIVEGKIVASNNTGKVCFLNFHKDWRRYFTAVIFASDFNKFPEHPEDYYLNRVVRVKGLVKEYRGKPEIILKSTNQIEIVE
jgi:micrococcal nuclease